MAYYSKYILNTKIQLNKYKLYPNYIPTVNNKTCNEPALPSYGWIHSCIICDIATGQLLIRRINRTLKKIYICSECKHKNINLDKYIK
jgi:hypothetical protein